MERVRLDWLHVIAACVAVLSIGVIYTVAAGFINGGTTAVQVSSVQHLAVERH
jgi:hypothetical protein